MSKAPAFQLYSADYFMDTGEWSIQEIGIYTRLLLFEWVNGDLPNEPERLSRLSGCTQKIFKKYWLTVSQKFTLNSSGRLTNLRLEEERIKQQKYRELQAEKGKIGAKHRWVNDSRGYSRGDNRKMALQSSSSSSNKKHTKEYSSDFLLFYNSYPLRIGREPAWKAWNKITDRPELDVLLRAIDDQKKWRDTANGEFRPEWKHPSTWLNSRAWEDTIEIREVKKAWNS